MACRSQNREAHVVGMGGARAVQLRDKRRVPRPDSEAVANRHPHPPVDCKKFVVACEADALGFLGRHEGKEGGSGRFQRDFVVHVRGRLPDVVGQIRGHPSKSLNAFSAPTQSPLRLHSNPSAFLRIAAPAPRTFSFSTIHCLAFSVSVRFSACGAAFSSSIMSSI